MAGRSEVKIPYAPVRVAIPADIDWKTKATDCVKILYTNGSDSRQEKNGKPGSLVDKLLKPSIIRTCGLFGKLSKEDQMIIDRKEDDRSRDSPEFKKRIAKFILECERKQHSDKSMFVKLTPDGREYLTLLATTSHETIEPAIMKKINRQFNVRTIFENQERQKVLH